MPPTCYILINKYINKWGEYDEDINFLWNYSSVRIWFKVSQKTITSCDSIWMCNWGVYLVVSYRGN